MEAGGLRRGPGGPAGEAERGGSHRAPPVHGPIQAGITVRFGGGFGSWQAKAGHGMAGQGLFKSEGINPASSMGGVEGGGLFLVLIQTH